MALFTTPSGAVVDADSGKLITPAPTTPTQQASAIAQGNIPSATPIPGQQTPEQMAATTVATGQTPAPNTPAQSNTPQEATIPPAPTEPTSTATQPNIYTGNSIVDFLKQGGQANDFSSRSKLAAQYGIKGYTGTAAQNTQLLNTLRTNQGVTTGDTPITTPTGTVGSSGTLGQTSTNAGGSTQPSGGGTSPAPVDKYANLDPIQKQVAMYQDSYKALGLSTIKDQFDKFTKQYDDLSKELSDKIGEKQNNPWLSATSRSEQVTKLQNDYSKRLDTFSRLATLTDSMYKTGLGQVDHMVSNANADIKATNDLAQKQIDAANALAKDNQVVSVGGRELLVSKATGKVVADLGPSNPKGTSLADKEALAAFNASLKTGSRGGGGGGSGTSGNSSTLQGMLNYFNTTGKLPAFGLSAKNPLRAQFYAALGGASGTQNISNAQTNQAVRAGLQKAYSTQQNQYSANQTAIGALDKQLALAQSYSGKVGRSGSPLINKYLLAAKSGVFGDPETAALNNIVTTASYEFAKILSGSAASIAGATVSSSEDAKTLLNSAMAKGQFMEVLNLMKKESQFRLTSQQDTLSQIKSDLSNVGNLNTSSSSSGSSSGFNSTQARSKFGY